MVDRILYVATTSFEAARSLDCLHDGHHARRLHGHSFKAEVRALLPDGWPDFPGAEVGQLTKRLSDCVAPLDYSHLNREIALPTDEALSRWIDERIDIPGIEYVAVQSTPHQGVALSSARRPYAWRRFRFESAHQLPNVPHDHKCGRMHGHGFEVVLHARRSLEDESPTIDYDRLDAVWAPSQNQLQHACLNDIPGLENPTSENISAWIWAQLKPSFPALSWVTVYETASCAAIYDGAHFRIWKEFSLDSAVRLKRAPEGDARRQIHGHTFTLRLHLHAPLDQVKGWVVDFGDVKEVFRPIFTQLDHQPLHELMGDDDSDTASIARRIKAIATPLIPSLYRIDLNETQGCGVILSWGDQNPGLSF